MTSRIDLLIDHAADLQRQVDRVDSELWFCRLAILALAIIAGQLTVQAWLRDRR